MRVITNITAILIILFGISMNVMAKEAQKESPKKETEKVKETTEEKKLVQMNVKELVTFLNGEVAVMLKEKSGDKLVPIWIGFNEAVSIHFRLERQKPPRPLTLDLLEEIMKVLDAKIEKLVIDSLDSGVYLGRLYIRHGKESFILDARPSDSIGLCVGANAPIFIDASIIEKAGISETELKEKASPQQNKPEQQNKKIEGEAL